MEPERADAHPRAMTQCAVTFFALKERAFIELHRTRRLLCPEIKRRVPRTLTTRFTAV